MGKAHSLGVESTAALFHHPIHPLLVPLPIASFVFALVTDLVYLFTHDAFWAQASFWLLVAGVVTGLAAGAVGAIDYTLIPSVRRMQTAQLHAAGNVTVVFIALINLFYRWFDHAGRVHGLGLLLSIATVGLLGITGWLGGALSYKYHVGAVAPENGGVLPEPEVHEL